MFCVGESFTCPDSWELVSSVRVDDPAVAVIVIEVALLICQFSVMLCPSLIDVALAEKTSVGAADGVGVGVGVGFWPETPEQEHRAQNAIGASPDAIQRKLIFFIRCMRAAEYRFQRA